MSINNVAIDSSNIMLITQNEYLKIKVINITKTNKVKDNFIKFKFLTS